MCYTDGIGKGLAMKDKRRSVNTRFWDDPFVEELTPSEKLLFLYLLTNPLTNLLGIYEITIKRIAYDTGLPKETIQKGLERFGTVRKAYFVDNFIVLPNWLKNQSLNKNMKVAVMTEFNELPKHIRSSVLGNGSEGLGNDSEGFRIIMECLEKYEREIEGQDESEGEDQIAYDAIVKYYNDTCKELPRVEKLTNERKKLIRARFTEHGKENIANAIKMVSKSAFLNGDNNKNWKANFDWIFNTNNFVKIIEKTYENGTPKQIEIPGANIPNLEKYANKL